MKRLIVMTGLACVVGIAGAQAQGGGGAPPPPPKPGTAYGTPGALSAADMAFVKEAAMGGMAEVELGKLATEKASSADVKQFGQRMVDDHGKAGDELKSLAESKKVTLPAALDAKHQAMRDRLSKLSGSAFDRAYMKEMVADHNKDVAAFMKASKTAADPDLKAWAGKTLPTLQEHQKMAKEIASKVTSTPN
jgi:putative membrane protein